MSTDAAAAKDQAQVMIKQRKRRLPRRIPSDLERMAKKVNEMRIANNDERLVIVNTICNVETNDALCKFMTIDGHVLLASWLNQALSQGHSALQVALLKLAARLPISGNMSTAIEAIVSELALKCPVDEIRELAKGALSQWQNKRPDPRHFSITIGDNDRKVIFERDPNYYTSSDDDDPSPKKPRSSRKSLQWAPEHRLEMVRVFHQQPEEKQSSSSSTSKTKTSQSVVAQISWSCPPSVIIPENCIVRDYASQSIEAAVQASRAAGLLEVVYFKKDQIPPNPGPAPQQPPNTSAPYTADLRNLPRPISGMKSAPGPESVLGLDSHENALALDELISANADLVDDLLETSDLGLDSAETQSFGFGRIRSPPPSARRDRPRSPPPVDLAIDNYGLPLPPSPPRSNWQYPAQRPPYHHSPPDRLPFDGYGRAGFRDHPAYPFEQDQRRRSPPRSMPSFTSRPPLPYNEFNEPHPPPPPQQPQQQQQHGRYEDYRGYPELRFPKNRFVERSNEFRDRPSSPFRGDAYPAPRSYDDRRGSGRICRFYQLPRGCSLGDSCSFLHENPAGSKGPPGPSHRSRARSRAKARGASPAAALSEPSPRHAESMPAEAETEGEFDQFGRLRKSPAPSPPPPALP